MLRITIAISLTTLTRLAIALATPAYNRDTGENRKRFAIQLAAVKKSGIYLAEHYTEWNQAYLTVDGSAVRSYFKILPPDGRQRCPPEFYLESNTLFFASGNDKPQELRLQIDPSEVGSSESFRDNSKDRRYAPVLLPRDSGESKGLGDLYVASKGVSLGDRNGVLEITEVPGFTLHLGKDADWKVCRQGKDQYELLYGTIATAKAKGQCSWVALVPSN